MLENFERKAIELIRKTAAGWELAGLSPRYYDKAMECFTKCGLTPTELAKTLTPAAKELVLDNLQPGHVASVNRLLCFAPLVLSYVYSLVYNDLRQERWDDICARDKVLDFYKADCSFVAKLEPQYENIGGVEYEALEKLGLTKPMRLVNRKKECFTAANVIDDPACLDSMLLALASIAVKFKDYDEIAVIIDGKHLANCTKGLELLYHSVKQVQTTAVELREQYDITSAPEHGNGRVV